MKTIEINWSLVSGGWCEKLVILCFDFRMEGYKLVLIIVIIKGINTNENFYLMKNNLNVF